MIKKHIIEKNTVKKFDELGILIVMIALFIFLSIASPFFLKIENIQNLLLQSVFVMLEMCIRDRCAADGQGVHGCTGDEAPSGRRGGVRVHL